MLQVRLITDPFDLAAYSEHHVDALVPFLQSQFDSWPETARLYRNQIAVECDVTPRTEEEVAELEAATDGIYYVVVYPGDPVTAVITVVATLALTALVLLFLTPKIPGANNDVQSANNTLGQRVNKPRPNARIEDIFGSVISIPTLLTVPLLVFENNLEQELCFMGVGRGSYSITRVRDGDTPLQQIAGAGAQFYGPGTGPGAGEPFLTVGAEVDAPLYDVLKVNEVNGQVMRAPNANSVSGDGDIRFRYPDVIERTDSSIDFTRYFSPGPISVSNADFGGGSAGSTTIQVSARFEFGSIIRFQSFDPSTTFTAGQNITISSAGWVDDQVGGTVYVDLSGTYLMNAVTADTITLDNPQDINTDWDRLDDLDNNRTGYRDVIFSTPLATDSLNLNGNYIVLSVSASQLVLADPEAVNSAWANVATLPGGVTPLGSPSISTNGAGWVGPFLVDMPTATQVVCNFVALQGMYRVTKKGKDRPASVQVEVEATPVDANSSPTGPAVTGTAVVSGDGTDKNPKGVTLYLPAGAGSRMSVRVRRTTQSDIDSEDTIVDEVKWRDLYGTAEISTEFGDITTVHTRTYATQGATSVKERKLNCRATRKVLVRNNDDTFGPALAASRNAADIICHMALDPYIGNRDLSELDVPLIYQTIDDVINYFGIPEVGQFNYTFDQDDVSFEEMVQTVAQAVFCTAYRQTAKLRLYFERATEDSELLFNHRNKLPGSETRTVRFGRLNDNDGVELDYISPVDGAKLTVYVPADRSARKPKKLSMNGVQSERHATLHAMRAYNKILYQNTTTKFDALQEASQLVLTQRIEATDNTRPDVYDGFITSVQGFTLGLSQPFTATPGVNYTIFIQREDGVEVLPVGPGADDRHVVLRRAPATAIVVDNEAAADIVYQITGDDGSRSSAFLVTEKGPFNKVSLELQAINYDERYYQDDTMYQV